MRLSSVEVVKEMVNVLDMRRPQEGYKTKPEAQTLRGVVKFRMPMISDMFWIMLKSPYLCKNYIQATAAEKDNYNIGKGWSMEGKGIYVGRKYDKDVKGKTILVLDIELSELNSPKIFNKTMIKNIDKEKEKLSIKKENNGLPDPCYDITMEKCISSGDEQINDFKMKVRDDYRMEKEEVRDLVRALRATDIRKHFYYF